MESGWWLGIDGGGTKTAAVILDARRRHCGRGHGGPCNIATCDDATLLDSVLTARREALRAAGLPAHTRVRGACAGVAGYTARSRRAAFLQMLRETIPADTHRVEPDFAAAYWGASEGEAGLAVIAGTGAVLYGRDSRGRAVRWDGLGFLFGDSGSGFDMGRQALCHALPRSRGGARPNSFARRVWSEIGAECEEDVIEWTYRRFDPARIAALAGAVGRWAEEGDPSARRIVALCAGRLAEGAVRCLDRMKLPPETAPIWLLGGLWRTTPLLRMHFLRSVRAHARRAGRLVGCLRIVEPRADAATGAALLAMRPAPRSTL